MERTIKYLSLALFLGIICKIYDDLSDNDLYSHFGISYEVTPYIEDILKGFFLLGFAILSIKHPFFLILFTAINVMLYFREKRDFPSYEFSGFVSPILLLPFLEWNEKNDYYKNIIWSLIILVIALLSEKMHYSKNDKDREYSNKKLLVRFGLVLVLSCAIFFSTSLYITSDILHLFYFGLGYLFISSITQYCLVNGIWKPGSLDTGNDEDNEEENNIEKKELVEEGNNS